MVAALCRPRSRPSQLSKLLNAEEDPETAGCRLIEQAAEVLRAERVTLFAVDREVGQLYVFASHGKSGPEHSRFSRVDSLRIPVSTHSIAGNVALVRCARRARRWRRRMCACRGCGPSG